MSHLYTNKPSENEVIAAIKEILKDKKAYTKSLNYAVDYCESAIIYYHTGWELKVQVRYILNNIQYWRGKGNKEIRKLLKEFVK